MRAIEYIQDQLESGLTVSGIARAVVPHAFVVRSPRLQLLTLFTPGGLEAAFRGESSPAQNLDLPTGAITYSMVELEKKRTPIQCIRCALPDLG
jgi:hypothetical protein